jgi:hypothetical protein
LSFVIRHQAHGPDARQKAEGAFHEPQRGQPCPRSGAATFMVSMQRIKVFAFSSPETPPRRRAFHSPNQGQRQVFNALDSGWRHICPHINFLASPARKVRESG